MTFRHLDLFAGIGGFSRAVDWLGGETVAFVEWESWNRRVLAKHWPGATFYGDIRAVSDDDFRGLGRIDLVTGGYPCQPFSLAGQRRGADDPRHLWPEMRRCINAVRPRFVLAENVSGHISMGLDTVLAELESDGYAVRPVVVPAASVDALHKRERVWIMAYTDEVGRRQGTDDAEQGGGTGRPWMGLAGSNSGFIEHGAASGMAASADPDADRAGRQEQCRAVATQAEHAAVEYVGGAAPVADATNATGEAWHADSVADCPERSRDAQELGRSGIRRSGGGTRNGDEASRPLDAGADGLRPGVVRRLARRSAQPELIRQAWADGSWESGLPRVVSDEPERRQKLMAAGNAIVPLVAYEILAVMLDAEDN